MAGDKSVVILAVSWAETVVGLIFFGLRFLSNWKIVARFRPDFAVAGLTVAIQVTAQIFLQLCVHHGMGRHVDTLSHEQQVQTLHWSWVFQLLAIAASMLGKLAILTFLTQIRGRHEKKPWLLIILGVLIAAVNIAVLGTILGQCTPMQKLWDDSLPGTCDPGRKLNQNYSFFQASFNTFSDAFLASYPIHLFWKLQMKLRIKVALSILMGLGWIAAICSAVKTYELKALTETSDITWAQPTLLIWASTEAWIVIVVGCVPPIRPLMERILQRLGLTSKKTSTPAYYHSGSNPYGAGRSLTTARGTNPHFQADAYRSSKSPFAEEGEGDLDWVELGDLGGRNSAGNGSKEHIVPGGNNVVVTTDIITQFDVLNGNGGGNGGGGGGHVHAISSNGSSGSADDWVRQTPDYRKGV